MPPITTKKLQRAIGRNANFGNSSGDLSVLSDYGRWRTVAS